MRRETRKFSTQLDCRFFIYGASFFGRRVVSQIKPLTGYDNYSAPRFNTSYPMYPDVPRRVVSSFSSVAKILPVSGFSQVTKSVVRRCSVFVVNFWSRPLASGVEYCQPVPQIMFFIYRNYQIATFFAVVTRLFAGPFSIPFFGQMRTAPPRKYSGAPIVAKCRPKILGRDVVAWCARVCFLGGSHSILRRSFRSEAGSSVGSARLPRLYAMGA